MLPFSFLKLSILIGDMSYFYRFLVSLILFHINGSHLYAQSQVLSFTFERKSIDDGLSHVTVNDILEDRQGFYWMATRYGLNFYDGYTFTTFLPDLNNKNSIHGYDINCLWESHDGKIWIGTRGAGISIYDPLNGRFRKLSDPLIDGVEWLDLTIENIFQDDKKHFWISTAGEGVFVIDQELKVFLHLHENAEEKHLKLSNNFVFQCIEDESGRIWIGAEGPGLHYFIDGKVRHFNADDKANMRGYGKCFAIQGNNLWVGTAGSGLYLVDLLKMKVKRHFILPSDAMKEQIIITDIQWQTSESQLWIATDGDGIHILRPEDNSWKHIVHSSTYPGSLNSNAIYDLYFDGLENLWVGTFNGGVSKMMKKNNPFETDRDYQLEKMMGVKSVLSSMAYEKGALLGTDGDGLFYLNLSDNRKKISPLFDDNPIITSMSIDNNNNLWMGSFKNGLWLLDLKSNVARSFKHDDDNMNSISHDNVWDLEIEGNGNLWIATLGGGVNLLQANDDKFYHFPGKRNGGLLTSAKIVDILLDTLHHKLWVATEDAGLNSIDLHSLEVESYELSSENAVDARGDFINCLLSTENGKIWLGSRHNGILIFDPINKTFTNHPKGDELISQKITGLVQDKSENVWISHGSRVSKWLKDEEKFIEVGKDPYLRNNQFNPRAMVDLSEQNLIIGGTSGYSLIKTSPIPKISNQPIIRFTELRVANEKVEIGQYEGRNILPSNLNEEDSKIYLSHGDKGISLKFTAVNNLYAEQTKYAYRLLGLDSNWYELEENLRMVNFNTLPSGSYNLEVKASTMDGTWSPYQGSIKIIVSYPFWRTTWFTIGLISILVAIISSVIYIITHIQRLRYRREKALIEQELLMLKNQNLEKDISKKQSKISGSVLQLAHKKELLNGIKSDLKLLQEEITSAERKHGVEKLVRKISQELVNEDYWSQYHQAFDQSFHNFFQKIRSYHSNLTQNEERLCSFIKLRMTNSEIAALLNITVNAVEQAKYRLKKKMGLPKAQGLNNYILKIEKE